MPVQQLPQTLRWLREKLLPEIAWPFIAHAFDFALRGGGGDARDAIRVSEAFVVKYNASSGQRELRYRDGCVLSFNIALNDLHEYEGGGTYFRALGDGGVDASALRSPKGHLLCHSSALMHGGHPIRSGVRYILVAFCTVDPAYMPWAARFYEHVQGVVDPGEVEGQPEYDLKRDFHYLDSRPLNRRPWARRGVEIAVEMSWPPSPGAAAPDPARGLSRAAPRCAAMTGAEFEEALAG